MPAGAEPIRARAAPPTPAAPAAPAARRARRAGVLPVAAALLGAVVAVPILTVAVAIVAPGTRETWRHLAATVLPEYVVSTAWLCAGVASGTALVGGATAWLVATHDFPGRRTLEWALVLPLAVPAYVTAYAYTDLLQFSGPVQTWLRASLGPRAAGYIPEVRSTGGAVAMFVLVLYPYVYLLTRTAFRAHAGGMAEVGRSLGLGGWETFRRVSVPLARPALAAGVALALMETLADYGTVAYFGVHTFTTGIYRAWFSLGDRAAAAQLATALLGTVALLLGLERLGRGRARFHDTTGRPARGRARLAGGRGILAAVGCALPVVAGFALPAAILVRRAVADAGETTPVGRFARLAGHSFGLAALSAAVAVGAAVILAYAARASRSRVPRAVNRVVALGYATPGAVIAVGILVAVTRLDVAIADAIQAATGRSPGLLLTGGVAALVYAYLVRFLAVALQAVEAALARITPRMDDAARSLGAGDVETLRRVHFPLLRGGVLTAGLLVFVDVMKELPATLVLRPFDFETLATQVYTLASDERLGGAALPALAIVAVGILPLVEVSRRLAEAR